MALPTRRRRGATRAGEKRLHAALSAAVAKVACNLPRWRGRFPSAASRAGRYDVYRQSELEDANAWTSGFWPGLLWLAFEASNDPVYRREGLAYVDILAERIQRRLWVDHHDLGFLYSPSCIAAYRLTGCLDARAAALRAADVMLGRFQSAGRFVQAWGPLDDAGSYRLIIDGLMNLPLLFWATDETGNPAYAEAARSHLDTTLAHAIRPDHSTFHTFYFDPRTGRPLRGVTHQGFSDHSCWARGQAWAIYGIALSLRYTRNPALIPVLADVTGYFLSRLPADRVCYWDLQFTSGKEERDSSAAAIAASGLLEAVSVLPAGALRDTCTEAADAILDGLIRGFAATTNEDGLLLHGVYSKPHQAGVDECCIWGDYFYLEALLRATRSWVPYW